MRGCGKGSTSTVMRPSFRNGLLGCEDAGEKARAGASTGADASAASAAADKKQAVVELAPLPVLNPPRRPLRLAVALGPVREDYLIRKVQEKFASGEQNFKAGHWKRHARI